MPRNQSETSSPKATIPGIPPGWTLVHNRTFGFSKYRAAHHEDSLATNWFTTREGALRAARHMWEEKHGRDLGPIPTLESLHRRIVELEAKLERVTRDRDLSRGMMVQYLRRAENAEQVLLRKLGAGDLSGLEP